MGCPNSIATAIDCNQSPTGDFTASCNRDCSEALSYRGGLPGDVIYFGKLYTKTVGPHFEKSLTPLLFESTLNLKEKKGYWTLAVLLQNMNIKRSVKTNARHIRKLVFTFFSIQHSLRLRTLQCARGTHGTLLLSSFACSHSVRKRKWTQNGVKLLIVVVHTLRGSIGRQ